MGKFIRYISLEEGLKGLFVLRTPKEVLEGYIDPLFYEISQKPIYDGGNQTFNVYQSYKSPPQAPKQVNVAFFTGTDGDYLSIKKYANWLGNDAISVKKKVYTTIWDLDDFFLKPWTQVVYVS